MAKNEHSHKIFKGYLKGETPLQELFSFFIGVCGIGFAIFIVSLKPTSEKIEKITEENYVFPDVNHVRSDKEEIIEWNLFRKNEDKYLGQITTWKLKLSYSSPRAKVCYIDGRDKGINILGTYGEEYDYYTQLEGQQAEKFELPRITQDDWIIVKGKFSGITEGGKVELNALEVKNLGYQD